MSNIPEIEIFTARVDELLTRFTSREGESAWQAVKKAEKELQRRIKEGNAIKTKEALAKLHTACERGAEECDIWREIEIATEQRSKLSAREVQRNLADRMYLSVDEAMQLMLQFVGIATQATSSFRERFIERAERKRTDGETFTPDHGAAIAVLLANDLRRQLSVGLQKLLPERRPAEQTQEQQEAV